MRAKANAGQVTVSAISAPVYVQAGGRAQTNRCCRLSDAFRAVLFDAIPPDFSAGKPNLLQRYTSPRKPLRCDRVQSPRFPASGASPASPACVLPSASRHLDIATSAHLDFWTSASGLLHIRTSGHPAHHCPWRLPDPRTPASRPAASLPCAPPETAKIPPSTANGAAGAPSPPPEYSHGAPPLVARALAPHAQVPSHPRQPSPSVQASPLTAQGSPSTLPPSPLPTPRAASAATAATAPNGGADVRGPEPARMRSQIACSKCRSSKVRCVNQGPGTQCDACASKGRTCSYPAPTLPGAGSGNPKRRENSLTATQDGPNGRSGEASVKKRKIAPLSTPLKDGFSGNWDLFNPQLFTRQTWHELYAIFEQHFATDLPFLHAETFINQLRRVDVRSPVDPFASLLYAFLALTTPFHDSFVRHPWHGQARQSTPVEISEKYASAARARLNSSNAYRKPNIVTTQALLMLGLHEWRNRQGAQCFLTIGSAINCAEMLGCHEQHDLDEGDALQPPQKPMAKPPGIKLPEDEPSVEDQLIAAEIKRRTYWCCFILDSYVSSGERRRQKVRIDEIKIQLPCNQRAFDLGLNVRTMMLDETPSQFENRRLEYERSDRTDSDMEVEWQFEKDQEALAWFIKALVVYRGVMDWVCNTTRRKAKRWPWDPESQFYQLKKRLDSLKQNLHSDLRLTDKRTRYHIRNRTSRSYVQLHSILALCDMALHREYIAYLPWDQKIPAGPVDGPMPPKLPKGKEKYWEENARSCFKAAKTFNDLIWTCKEEGALVETPVVGFAMFYVMQIVIWCRFFPSQDEEDWLCTIGTRHDRKLSENLDKAFSILFHMHERLPMARMWCRDSKDYVDDLERLRKERQGTGESPVSNNSNSTEGSNTGLSHWERIEKRLKEFFCTKDDDLDADDHSVTDLRHMDHTSEPDSPHPVKSEHEDVVDTPLSASRAPASFVAINGNGPQNGGTPKAMDRQTSTPAPGPYPQPYPNGSYGPAFGMSPKAARAFPSPTAYHPIESKERETLNPPVYKYALAAAIPTPISQYTDEQVHPQPCHDYGTGMGWLNGHYMGLFAAGNDENNAELPWNASHGFQDNYVNAGNNAIQ